MSDSNTTTGFMTIELIELMHLVI